jgi:predicted ester cyclase
MKIEDSIAEGDKVTVRITVEGTHQGGQLGVAPTGRRIKIAGVVIIRIANGQIVEGWNSWDQLGLLRQIGALPAQKGPDQFTTARA